MTTANEITINVFRDFRDSYGQPTSHGVWCAAVWIDGEYDSCDPLNVPSDVGQAGAVEAAKTMPMLVSGPRKISVVDDIYA